MQRAPAVVRDRGSKRARYPGRRSRCGASGRRLGRSILARIADVFDEPKPRTHGLRTSLNDHAGRRGERRERDRRRHACARSEDHAVVHQLLHPAWLYTHPARVASRSPPNVGGHRSGRSPCRSRGEARHICRQNPASCRRSACRRRAPWAETAAGQALGRSGGGRRQRSRRYFAPGDSFLTTGPTCRLVPRP